jgi:hypothetical protein
MPLDFPPSPTIGYIYTYEGRSWIWNGTAWDVYSTVSGNVVTQLNGLTGGVTLAAGLNITLTPVGNTITIESSGGSCGGISGPYVISFNGLTGAVTGVSSIRGLTGAVGLTNGSGIGLSVSGNTLTVSNTGVLSVNGATGAITNVAKLDESQQFIGINTFTNLAEFTANISMNEGGASNIEIGSLGDLSIGAVTDVRTRIRIDDDGQQISHYATSGHNFFNSSVNADSGISSAGGTFSAVTRFNSGIVVTGATMSGTVSITGVVTPTTDLDAANKFYVDSVASTGIHYHQPVVLASTDAETFASGVTYDNGASGVGAFLRKTSSFARINIDGIDGSTGDRILVRSASTQQWNGVYDVTNQGDGSTGWILTRSADANNYHPHDQDGLGENDYFFVQNGTTLKGNAYICSVPGGITFGTTAITFALFSTPPVYTAGTGLALNSLQFSNTGVLSFNGLTGAVTGVTTADSNIFGPLQTFTNGVSASGGATFGGSVNIVNTLLINGDQGSNSQVLTSTGTGITWATSTGGVTSVEGLTGDVVLPAINFMLYNMGIV